MPRLRDKAQRDYVRGWESASRKPYPYKDVPPTNSRKRSGPRLSLRDMWEYDRLGVLSVVTAVVGFAFWAWPSRSCLRNEWVPEPWPGTYRCLEHQIDAFGLERLPVAGALFALAVSLALFRRRKAAGVFVRRLKEAWKRDRLGVLGVGSAVIAFVLWAFPVRYYTYYTRREKPFWEDFPPYSTLYGTNFEVEWFTTVRLPAIAAFLALAFVLLLLRRR